MRETERLVHCRIGQGEDPRRPKDFRRIGAGVVLCITSNVEVLDICGLVERDDEFCSPVFVSVKQGLSPLFCNTFRQFKLRYLAHNVPEPLVNSVCACLLVGSDFWGLITRRLHL